MAHDWKKRCDNSHLGHFFVDLMRKRSNEICQMDAATGEEETCSSVLSRSIRMAQCFGRRKLVPGDTVVVGGRNHLDVHIPFYAGLMSGQPTTGLDPALKSSELMQGFLKLVKPKIAFCEYPMLEEYKKAVQILGLDTELVTFGGGDNSMTKFMEANRVSQPENEYQVATFNTDEVYCWLVSTSGSTGQPKIVALTHPHILIMKEMFYFPADKSGVRKYALNLSTLHWISGCFHALMMPINHIKLQSSALFSPAHVVDIINKYKPTVTICTPTFLASILAHETHCDLTSFDMLKVGGTTIRTGLLKELRDRVRADTVIIPCYGLTESGAIFMYSVSEKPYGSYRIIHPNFEVKLVATETGKEVFEPGVFGEMFLRGPTMACYYNDSLETKNAYSEDGFLKTGDLFYKDRHGSYYFVERLKMLLKYKTYQIAPPDVENVILRHPGVADVCVTGVPHAQDGEHVVACVVRKPGAQVTAQEIKDLVAENLSASKHLHGGVVFLDSLPLTPSGKVARVEVKRLAVSGQIE